MNQLFKTLLSSDVFISGSLFVFDCAVQHVVDIQWCNDDLIKCHSATMNWLLCVRPHFVICTQQIIAYRFGKSGYTERQKLVPWGTDGRLPLSDLASGHTAYRRASLIDLNLHTKFHWDRKKKIFESHHWGFGQVQSHVTQKLGQISKIRPDQI